LTMRQLPIVASFHLKRFEHSSRFLMIFLFILHMLIILMGHSNTFHLSWKKKLNLFIYSPVGYSFSFHL
jgi:hypothetical protein